MSRSLKKGPYIAVSLEKKILAMNESGKKSVVKTWLDTSSENLLLRVSSVAMQVTRKSKQDAFI